MIVFAHDFLAHEFHEFSRKRVQSRTCSGYAERSRKSRGKNLEANIRAAENIELVKIRATYKVAII